MQCGKAMQFNAMLQFAMKCNIDMVTDAMQCFLITLFCFHNRIICLLNEKCRILKHKTCGVCKIQYIFLVDGNWESWSIFGKCSKSCGSGTQLRRRFNAFFQSMEIGEVGVVLVNVQNLVRVEPN